MTLLKLFWSFSRRSWNFGGITWIFAERFWGFVKNYWNFRRAFWSRLKRFKVFWKGVNELHVTSIFLRSCGNAQKEIIGGKE